MAYRVGGRCRGGAVFVRLDRHLTRYGNDDREAWFNDVGVVGNADITTIGFTGFAAGTSITDQYRELGVTFDGNNITRGEDFIAYPQDG